MVVETEFYQKQIGSHSDAPTHMENFEKKGGKLMLPITFYTNRKCSGCGFCGCCAWWLTIPENFKAVVSIHGKLVGVWGAGCHFAPPWVSLPFLIPEHPFNYSIPVRCTSAGGVQVTLVPSIVVLVDTSQDDNYHFAGIMNFVNKLGAAMLSNRLNAMLESWFRETVKTLPYHETCEFIDGKLNNRLEEAVAIFNGQFVEYGILLSKLSVKKMFFDDPYTATGRAQRDGAKARREGNINLRSKYQRVLKCIEDNALEEEAMI